MNPGTLFRMPIPGTESYISERNEILDFIWFDLTDVLYIIYSISYTLQSNARQSNAQYPKFSNFSIYLILLQNTIKISKSGKGSDVVAHERLTEPGVTMDWLLAKPRSFSNLPAFLDISICSVKAWVCANFNCLSTFCIYDTWLQRLFFKFWKYDNVDKTTKWK